MRPARRENRRGEERLVNVNLEQVVFLRCLGSVRQLAVRDRLAFWDCAVRRRQDKQPRAAPDESTLEYRFRHRNFPPPNARQVDDVALANEVRIFSRQKRLEPPRLVRGVRVGDRVE